MYYRYDTANNAHTATAQTDKVAMLKAIRTRTAVERLAVDFALEIIIPRMTESARKGLTSCAFKSAELWGYGFSTLDIVRYLQNALYIQYGTQSPISIDYDGQKFFPITVSWGR